MLIPQRYDSSNAVEVCQSPYLLTGCFSLVGGSFCLWLTYLQHVASKVLGCASSGSGDKGRVSKD